MKLLLDHLYGYMEPREIKDFLDEMFESWLDDDCSEHPSSIRNKHAVKRLLGEVVEELYKSSNN